MAVPEARGGRVEEILVDSCVVRLPHLSAVVIIEEIGALEDVLVIGTDAGAQMTFRFRPLSGRDVDPLADQIDARAMFVYLEKSDLGMIEVGRFSRNHGERPKLGKQCANV